MLNNILFDRLRLPFRKEKELFSSLYSILGFYPQNIEYYKMALMHKSVAKRNAKGKPVNNERLEFLGDAILDAVVGDIVYRHFEGKREGFLTNTRSKLVQRDTLNKLAQEMGINQLILSAGHNNTHNSYVGGNAFEALVGAIYLDRGYNYCMKFMQKQILQKLINIDKVAYKEVNFKSKLIEWSQKNKVRLDFKLISQGKDNTGSPTFNYKTLIEGLEGASGLGYSKKESQQNAAKETLQRLKREPQFIDAVFEAKGNRTKMEESPILNVPDTEEKNDFIITANKEDNCEHKEKDIKPQAVEMTETSNPTTIQSDEFDLSDITAKPKTQSREDIIAAAEAAAFAE
ncbi:ribonuclease III [Prevotella sp. P2-180]|uniref:ribonuclease III n=1 Tax=Prevotella sp. P2-180 TaxID=2024224 RepID=UPI000B968169|nr:ribonuclease III [Prevotella sp. P2-180]OYP63562.1 ribonuclease III [Prevotella sp. P2-180]